MVGSAQVGGSSQNQKFIIEPDKFHLGGKKTLLRMSATKDHWLMLSQAAITCSSQASSTQGL